MAQRLFPRLPPRRQNIDTVGAERAVGGLEGRVPNNLAILHLGLAGGTHPKHRVSHGKNGEPQTEFVRGLPCRVWLVAGCGFGDARGG